MKTKNATKANQKSRIIFFAITDNVSGKDKLLTKIRVLAVSAFTVILLLFSYIFVFKPEVPYLSNGRDTLWDTQTEDLADEICAGCDTDAEKVQAIYSWMIANLEYDYDYHVLFQYFNVRKTLSTKKGVCFDFLICLLHSAAVKTFLAMLLTEYLMRTVPFSTPGTVCIMTVFGGTWM